MIIITTDRDIIGGKDAQNKTKKKFAKREWQTLNKHEDIKREYKNLFFKALNHHSDFGFLN